VLVLLSVILLWRNVVARHIAWYDPVITYQGQETFHKAMLDGKYWIWGWPLVTSIQPIDPSQSVKNMPDHTMAIITNIVVAIHILLAVAVLFEFAIRRVKRVRNSAVKGDL
jgi:hypothetical protein